MNKEGEPTLFPKAWLPDNNTRAEKQQKLPLQVIVGNPPWSAKQRNAADNNPNVNYPTLAKRIKETYVEFSTATNKNGLYDTYKMAIRWASDRIGRQGIIAFVTNGSWIDGNADAGVRACLTKEFTSIYVLNLRGNARTSGEHRRSEGDNVFGQGSRAPVAITILVKNPNATHDGCRILYHDVGDYKKREQKLEALKEAVSIQRFTDLQEITPDKHHDWINQRNPIYARFYSLGSKNAKAGTADDAIFRLYSQGLATGRDSYIYNFSREACAENARKMTADYLNALAEIESNPEVAAEEVTHHDSSNIKWDRELKKNLNRQKKTEFEQDHLWKVAYRPFVATNCYVDYTFVYMKFQMDRIFPDSSSANRVICVPGIGNKKPFSVLMTDTMTDVNISEASAQCFPRYFFQKPAEITETTETFQGIDEAPECIDNISNTALDTFCLHYHDNTITKDMIFDYIYGVLHSKSYREEFANDLSKGLPHIPFAPDFHDFAKAGKALAALHLGYETCKQYPLSLVFAHNGEPQPHHFQLTEKAMRFATPAKTTLIINEHVRLTGIPEAAHRYVVNGRTPLEWFIDRYKIKRDKESGILNDPNGWFENPQDLITAIKRIVHVSVESTRIIEELPARLNK